MYTATQKLRCVLSKLLLSLIVLFSTGTLFTLNHLTLTESAHAETVDQLNQRKKQLEDQVKKAEQDARNQKTVAQRAEDKINEVSAQIGQLEGSIGSTDGTIVQTKTQIEQKNQDVANLEAGLRKVKDQQDALIRQIYIMRMSLPDELVLFSNESVSKRERDQSQFQALKKSLASIYTKTNTAKIAVETTRNDLMQKSTDLNNLKTQQQEQKMGLADVKLTQAQLKDDAEGAVLALEQKARAARMEEGKIEQQISAALTAAIRANSNKSGGKLTGTNAGQRVRRGDVIGHLGSTGYSSGPHVHFEVRVNNSAVNPSPYVSNGTLVWPVNSFQISQGFGYTDYAQGGAYGGSIHTGIDLAGPYGQPVYAPADGTVILRQYYGGYGNAWAEQLDNGTVVLLGHMTGS